MLRKRRGATRLVLPAAVAAMAGCGPASADACASRRWGGGSPSSIPDCELQGRAPVSDGGRDTKGRACRCGGNHPCFRGRTFSYAPSFTSSDNGFSVSEDAASEAGDNSKVDATITNRCFRKEGIGITLACASQVPPSPLSQAR